MSNQRFDEWYVLDGVPMRRLRTIGYQRYSGRGKWETLENQDYARRAGVPLTKEDFKGLMEAHDLAKPPEMFDEDKWQAQAAAEHQDACRAGQRFDLSSGEIGRANWIATLICNAAQAEAAAKGRLRPRVAMAAMHAANAAMTRWAEQPENVGYDKHLPPYEEEALSSRIHVYVCPAPGTRFVGRSPLGAAAVLLERGVDAVRRFNRQPFVKAMKNFRRRCVFIRQDSEESSDWRANDSTRWRAAAKTWQALTPPDQECLLGLLTAFGVDTERLVTELQIRGGC